jgi:hypothetical protein
MLKSLLHIVEDIQKSSSVSPQMEVIPEVTVIMLSAMSKEEIASFLLEYRAEGFKITLDNLEDGNKQELWDTIKTTDSKGDLIYLILLFISTYHKITVDNINSLIRAIK